MGKYLKVSDINAYKISLELSKTVWSIVINWDYFEKKTIGSQFVDAVDSISANIAEGWGRYHKKDKIRFFYTARGSVEESKDWAIKALSRKLLSKDEYTEIINCLNALPREIHFLISITNKKLSV